MRLRPTNKYNGITLVLSNPSRFDKNTLLSGYAGYFINEECLRPDYNRYQCDIRTADTLSQGLLDQTRCIILFGERALHTWTQEAYAEYSIGEQRGCLLNKITDGRIRKVEVVLATFFPQDAIDIVDWESKYNPEAEDQSSNEDEEEDETGKHKGITARSNYGFWIKRDIRKAIKLLSPGGRELYKSPNSTFTLYPGLGELFTVLTKTKGQSLFLDIETDTNQNVTCIGFGFSIDRIYVVPILLYNYTPAYSSLGKVFQALYIGMRDNEVVCHNALFDLFILAWKYKLPVGHRIYDTMLAHHRCWPEVEKSLGHAMSHLLWEPYHKDSGIFNPQNDTQQRRLWEYNANDVRGTMLIKSKLDEYAAQVRGLPESITQVNSSVRPDLINTLQGIRYSEEERSKLFKENDRLMTHYHKMIERLVGYELLASSPKQCVDYFHNSLGYKAISKTGVGNPSLGKDNIYKLKLKYPDNPVLDFVLAFRRLSKQSGTLKFIPWMKDPNAIEPPS
jgi:hypothetical protein